jgi:hypothetical protein
MPTPRLRRLEWCTIVLCTALQMAVARADEPAAGLAGTWRGKTDVGQASMALADQGTGFTIRWEMPGHPPLDVGLERDGETAGVYRRADGGLLSLFDRERGGDPLDGEPLVWARVAGETLVVYRLAIDSDGGYTLDRMALRREADDVAAELVTRSSVAEPVVLSARLSPAGRS